MNPAEKIWEAQLLYANAERLWRMVPKPSYDRPTFPGLQMLEAFRVANALVPAWYVRMRGQHPTGDPAYPPPF